MVDNNFNSNNYPPHHVVGWNVFEYMNIIWITKEELKRFIYYHRNIRSWKVSNFYPPKTHNTGLFNFWWRGWGITFRFYKVKSFQDVVLKPVSWYFHNHVIFMPIHGMILWEYYYRIPKINKLVLVNDEIIWYNTYIKRKHACNGSVFPCTQTEE